MGRRGPTVRLRVLRVLRVGAGRLAGESALHVIEPADLALGREYEVFEDEQPREIVVVATRVEAVTGLNLGPARPVARPPRRS